MSLAILGSCDFGSHKFYLRSYVHNYIKSEGIKLDGPHRAEKYLYVDMDMTKGVETISEHTNEEAYDEICEHFGDMSYDKEIEISRITTLHRDYSPNEYLDIDIFSDAAYDDSHSAGASLNNIVRFMAFTPLPYIESGYTLKYDFEENPASEHFMKALYDTSTIPVYNKGTLHPIDKLASELTAADMRLLGTGNSSSYIALYFESEPTLSKVHNITVKMTTTEGEVLTATTELRFE